MWISCANMNKVVKSIKWIHPPFGSIHTEPLRNINSLCILWSFLVNIYIRFPKNPIVIDGAFAIRVSSHDITLVKWVSNILFILQKRQRRIRIRNRNHYKNSVWTNPYWISKYLSAQGVVRRKPDGTLCGTLCVLCTTLLRLRGFNWNSFLRKCVMLFSKTRMF